MGRSRLRTRLALTALLLVSGCASGPDITSNNQAEPAANERVHALGSMPESLERTWKRLVHSERACPASWEWVTALPNGAKRADAVVPSITGSSLGSIVPQWHEARMQLASTSSAVPGYQITAVNDTLIGNCDQLHAAMLRALGSRKKVLVRLARTGQEDNTLSVEPAQLLALVQAAAPEERLLRVTEDGNPWVVVRQDGVRCKVMGRIERQRALLQVALELGICWGSPMTLPQEVRASCDGEPLQCLSVGETLEVLYGRFQSRPDNSAAQGASFAAVSERDDYRIPTNYKRLQEAAEAAGEACAKPSAPAFASLPGLVYPGPALLGDARALTAFILQRQVYRAGEPEHVGWILFSGKQLRHGNTIDLHLDLGYGRQCLTFTVPDSHL